jgi:hypothetical protein
MRRLAIFRLLLLITLVSLRSRIIPAQLSLCTPIIKSRNTSMTIAVTTPSKLKPAQTTLQHQAYTCSNNTAAPSLYLLKQHFSTKLIPAQTTLQHQAYTCSNNTAAPSLYLLKQHCSSGLYSLSNNTAKKKPRYVRLVL